MKDTSEALETKQHSMQQHREVKAKLVEEKAAKERLLDEREFILEASARDVQRLDAMEDEVKLVKEERDKLLTEVEKGEIELEDVQKTFESTQRLLQEEQKKVKETKEKYQIVVLELRELRVKHEEMVTVAGMQEKVDMDAVRKQLANANIRRGLDERKLLKLNKEIESLRRALSNTSEDKRFRDLCEKLLVDVNTPGVSPPKRKGGGYSMYPEPSRTNVRMIVKSLVDGKFNPVRRRATSGARGGSSAFWMRAMARRKSKVSHHGNP